MVQVGLSVLDDYPHPDNRGTYWPQNRLTQAHLRAVGTSTLLSPEGEVREPHSFAAPEVHLRPAVDLGQAVNSIDHTI